MKANQRIPHVTPRFNKRDSVWVVRCRQAGRDIAGRGRTRQQCVDDFADKWLAFNTHNDGLGDNVTVAQWWTYLQTLSLPGIESTRTTRRNVIENYVLPQLGGLPLDAVSTNHGDRLVAWLLAQNYSKQTAAHGLKAARWLLNEAVRLERLDKNRLDHTRLPKTDDAKRFLTIDEQNKLIAASSGDPFQILVHALLGLGLRNGELGGLQWDDLDLDKQLVQVRRQLTDVANDSGKVLTAPPKYNSTRTLPLTDSLCQLLERHHEQQTDRQRSQVGGRWDGNNFVVLNRNGAPLSKDRLRDNVARIGAKAHLNDHDLGAVNCQVLRRTCATRLLNDGVDLMFVSRWLGHSDIKQTQTYLQVKDERLKGLAEFVAKWGV